MFQSPSETSPEATDRLIVHADPDFKELIPGFLEATRDNVATILGDLEANNFERVRILGHNAKGTGGCCGFDAISELGAAIEVVAEKSDGEEVRRKVAELDSYLGQVEVVYN